MEKQATSLRSLQELLAAQHKQGHDVSTINRDRAYIAPVDLIDVYPERNIRPIDQKAVREYADLMKQGVRFPPIEVSVEKNRLVVRHGYHRTLAAKLAVEEGHQMAGLQVMEFRGNTADAIVLMLNSENQVPVDPVSRAEAYLKLKNQNFTTAQIAERCSRSGEHVAQMLLLAEAEEEVKALVREDKIAAYVVIEKLREQRAGGRDHVEVCREMIENAAKAGKAKATRKHSPTTSAAPKLKMKVVRNSLESLSSIQSSLRSAFDEHALTSFVATTEQPQEITVSLPAEKVKELIELLELASGEKAEGAADGEASAEQQNELFQE